MASDRKLAIRSGSRWRQALYGLALLGLATVAGLWIAVHRVPWMGPLVADSLRALVGKDIVAKTEEWAYAVEDRYNRIFRGGEPPKAYWQVPSASAAPPVVASARALPESVAAFRLQDVGPVHQAWSAPGDGTWVPMPDPRRSGTEPSLMKTLLHPDRNRSWAELFVVAVDLRRVEVKMVLGYQEPVATTREGLEKLAHRSPARPAVIPPHDQPRALAAFNGGFKTEHGNYGVMLEGTTVVAPRKRSCAFARTSDGTMYVNSWDRLEPKLDQMAWYRQGPSCMVEDGKLHPGLLDPNTMWWGATLDGDTVIRRSAVGIDASHRVLYVAITNATTARALADGMRHVGAVHVAQLDVNWSYPKFVTFEPAGTAGELKPVALASGFELSPGEYLTKRSMRDFFYLLEKPTEKMATSR